MRPPPAWLAWAAVTALGAWATGPVMAQATAPSAQTPPPSPTQVQLYGTLDMGVGHFEAQPPGPPNAPIVGATGVQSGILQNSYFGLRGSEDLGQGVTAKFVLESFIRADTGQTGRFDATPASGADPFWSREAYVGLASRLGEVRLGNNTNPLWISMVQTSPLSTNSLFSPVFRQLFNGGTRGKAEIDSAMPNSVKYNTPNVAGLEGSVVVAAGEGSGSRYNLAANVGYRQGPWVLSLAHMQVRHAAPPTLPGVRHQDTTLLGAAYDFGVVRLFGQYTHIDNPRLATKDKVLQVGLTAPIGNGSVQLASSQDKTTGATPAVAARRTTTSLGYVYPLSRRTDVYAFVMNDKVNVGTANSYVTGMRLRF